MHNFQDFWHHFFPSANIFSFEIAASRGTHALPHNNEPNSLLIQLQCHYAHLFRLCSHNNHALKYLKYILDFLFFTSNDSDPVPNAGFNPMFGNLTASFLMYLLVPFVLHLYVFF